MNCQAAGWPSSIARRGCNMPRDFWYLWQGQLVSQVGTQAFQVLALFWLASHTAHAGAGALFLTLSLLPPVILGPYLARWAGRFAPNRVMVACDIASSTLALPVLAAVVLGAPAPAVVAMLLVSNTLLALTHALMLPTVHATVPALVDGHALHAANGWMQTTQQVATVLGQGFGGVVYALVGPAGLCLANMAGFALSGALISRLRSPGACNTPAPSVKQGAPWSLLRANPALRRLTVVSAVFNVLYAPWLVLLPFHLSAGGTLDASTLGLVLASYGLGSLCGNVGLTRLLKQLGSNSLWRALCVTALALILLGQTTGPIQIAAVLFLMGIAIGLVNVQIVTRLQLSVEGDTRAGAIAVMRSSVHLATPLGYGIVAVAQHSLTASPGSIFTACGLLLLSALLCMRRMLR